MTVIIDSSSDMSIVLWMPLLEEEAAILMPWRCGGFLHKQKCQLVERVIFYVISTGGLSQKNPPTAGPRRDWNVNQVMEAEQDEAEDT